MNIMNTPVPMESSEPIVVYTDGAARGNPGPGGYGIVLMWKGKAKEISAGFRHTTNNRMELMAVIVALENLKRKDIPVVVYSDSRYVVDAVEKGWLRSWLANGFKGGKKNVDLWKRYAQMAASFKITFKWVKGHASNPYNNRCDELATQAADGKNLLVDEAFENGINQ